MVFNISQPAKADYRGWERRFAWWPTRINPKQIVWLESYLRMIEVVDEGGWAGGYKWRYHYDLPGGQPDGAWRGPLQGV